VRVAITGGAGFIGANLARTLERQHRPARTADVRHSQADSTRLRELLSDLEPADFREGLEATVGWFRTLEEYRCVDRPA
jgi:nucleoside-diphosphate-sugar epimerase